MDDLDKIAPNLSKIKKDNPFKVPNNYFDDFYARLEPQLHSEGTSNNSHPIIRYLKPIIGLAASFAIIFMVIYWPLSNFNKELTAQNGDNQIQNTIDEQYSILVEDLDENSLFAFFNTNSDEENLSDEELISYLSASVSDYDLFIEMN